MPIERTSIASRTRVFVDTHIVTLFHLLENPEAFKPAGEESVTYMVTLPVLRELEVLKNEHHSEGQKHRARRCFELLEEAERLVGSKLSENTAIALSWQEPDETGLRHSGLTRPQTPDEHFIAAVFATVQHNSNPSWNTWVMSDDAGVRIRVKHYFDNPDQKVRPIAPPPLRYAQESFNLPQLVKATVRDLAVQLAATLRSMEQEAPLSEA